MLYMEKQSKTQEVEWIKTSKQRKDYLKCTSKPSYMLHKIFDNNLVAMHKSKLALKLNKPAYIGMWIFELSNVLMYEFHNDYIENKYDNKSKLLLTHNGSLIYYTKTEDVYEDFSSNKEMLILVIISLSQNTMIIQTN